jgi:hypothetical protein
MDDRLIVESPDVEEGERYVAIDDRGWAGLVAIEKPAPFHCYDCGSQGSWAHWVRRLPCIHAPALLVGPTTTDWPKARALSGLDNLSHESCPPRPPRDEADGETSLISTGDLGPRLGSLWFTSIQLDIDGDGRADLEARARTCPGQLVGLYPRVVMEWRAHDGHGWRVTERFFVPAVSP